MKHLIYSIAFLSLFSTSVTHAQLQGDQNFEISWNVGFPDLGISNRITETSLRGIEFQYSYFLSSNFNLGIKGGWSIFNQTRYNDTYQLEAGAITATVWNYVQVFPLQVTGRYFYNPDSRIKLFGGGGLGVTFTNKEVWVGILDFVDNGGRFSVYPELGINIPMGMRAFLNVAGTYNFVLDKDFNDGHFSYWGVSLALGWLSN